MPERTLSYFVSDVHLGLDVKDMAGREKRFLDFLESIPADKTESLFLMGDIWDFWYEYRDVVPRGYVRVFASLLSLKDRGVKIFFFQGNHDIWTYSYFEEMGFVKLKQPYVRTIGSKVFCLGHGDGLGPVVPRGYVRVFASLLSLKDRGVKIFFFQGNHDIWTYSYFEEMGFVKLKQPYVRTIGSKVFCLGHGDGLGPGMRSYKVMRWIFHNHFLQTLFSGLHPWFAFRLGQGWSKSSRLAKSKEYIFRGKDEPLYKWAESFQEGRPSGSRVDYFIFGHYHTSVDMPVDKGGRLLILKDWMDSSPYMVYDSAADEMVVEK